MNEIFLSLEDANRGWVVKKTSEGLTLAYRRLVDGKYVYGDSVRIPFPLMKKLLDESVIIRKLMEDD